ncbi:MAG: hypothetical protein PWR02_84 [Synergistales bacterium]|jgi:hypothetical protein|nr:hypothetical protein [Synergistales bacterium]
MTDGRTTSETLHEFVDVLREKNHEQQQALLDLLGVLKREREALAEGQPELLPGLLTELQEVSSRAMRAEAQRDAAATKLAGVLGCRPVLREICEALPEGEAARLNDQAEGLIAAVSALREVNYILSRQADQQRFLAEMILERLKHLSPGSGTGVLDTMA